MREVTMERLLDMGRTIEMCDTRATDNYDCEPN